MIKLIYCYWGAGIALGVSGPYKDVEVTCGKLFNYRATDSDPIWLNEKPDEAFAYILTSWERLKRGLSTMFVAGMLQSKKMKSRNFKKGFMCPPAFAAIADKKAENYISRINPEQFLGTHTETLQTFVAPKPKEPDFTQS